MQLTTRRFVLRDFVPADEPQLRAYQADPAYRRYYDPDHSPNSGELLHRFQTWAAAMPRRNFQLAVPDRAKPARLIGCCGLRTEDAPPGEADFGIEIAPAYWGRYGYATEMTAAMVVFGFRALGLAAIRASTVSANAPAARLARHFGFVPWGEPEVPEWMRERGWSEVAWRLTRDRWAGLPPRWKG